MRACNVIDDLPVTGPARVTMAPLTTSAVVKMAHFEKLCQREWMDQATSADAAPSGAGYLRCTPMRQGRTNFAGQPWTCIANIGAADFACATGALSFGSATLAAGGAAGRGRSI